LGILISTEKYNDLKIDRTKWYSIDYIALDSFSNGVNSHFSKRDDHEDSLTSPLPENTTESTSEITTTTDEPVVVVPSGEKEKDNDPSKTVSLPAVTEAVKEIMASLDGTPLEGKIPESVISTFLTDYNPTAHQAHHPETAPEGITRLIQWTASQMGDPRAAPISNPVAFLRDRARKGMDRPPAVLRAEQAAKAERRGAEERKKRRAEAETLKKEREIPPEARAELDRLLGRAAV
jgi:hypothetical protein